MINTVQLQKLVQQGEGFHLEFKAKATHPEKIAKEMIAFANAKGGTILIGVDDDKTIKGCKFPEEEIYTITEFLSIHCPHLQYELLRIPINKTREVLSFFVPESENKPEYVKDIENPSWRHAYIRVADKSMQASREMQFVLRYEKDTRDVRLFYGQREEKIMKYLEESPTITLQEAQKLLQIHIKPTSITLVTMVRAGLLQIVPTEQGDYFCLKEGAFQ